MKGFIFRISVAILTFLVGVAFAAVWTNLRSPRVCFPHRKNRESFMPLGEMARHGLPCAMAVFQNRDASVTSSVAELIDSGADVNSTADSCIDMEPSPRGVTLLMQASFRGDLDIVKLLLNKGANVNLKNSYGESALAWAARGRHPEIVDVLLERGGDVDTREESGRTPLMDAAGTGDLDVVTYLLGKGASVNAKDSNGTTPLMFAAGGYWWLHARANRRRIFGLLVRHGADPAMKDRRGRTAETYARLGFPDEYIIYRR